MLKRLVADIALELTDARAALLRAALVPLAPAAVGSWVYIGVGSTHAKLAFFAAASQIIPLLLVVLALEQRYFFRLYALSMKGPAREIERALYIAYPLVLLLLFGMGEWAALEALATGKPDINAAKMCAGAIAGGFTAACLLPLAPTRPPGRRPYDRDAF